MSPYPQDPVTDKLHHAWRKERRFIHLRGLTRLLVWAITLLLIGWLVDVLFISKLRGSDNRLLWLLLGINALILSWTLINDWLRHLKPFDALRVALQFERKHPELASLLVSYVQFKDGADDSQPNVSGDLLDAMRTQALDATRPLDFREIIDFSQLRRLLGTALTLILLFGGISYYKSEHFKILLRRIAGVDARYPTLTRITHITPSSTIPKGGSLTLTARVAGRTPTEGILYVRSFDDQPWQSTPLSLGEDLSYAYDFREVYEDFSYYAAIGDDVTEPMQVTVIPSPQVVQARIAVQHPDYMQTADTLSDDLNMEAPRGCTLRWELTLDRPVSAATVLLNDTESRPLAISADGLICRFEMRLDANLRYIFKWTERDHGFVFEDILRAVRALEDRLPEVKLLSPAENGIATAARKIPITAGASDDYGLTGATLVYSHNAGPKQRIPLGKVTGREAAISYLWDLSKTFESLGERDVITFVIEVNDGCLAVEGGQIGRSDERSLEILSVSEYLRRMADRLAEERIALLNVFEEEKASLEGVGQLILEVTGETPASLKIQPATAERPAAPTPTTTAPVPATPAATPETSSPPAAPAATPATTTDTPKDDWWDRL